MEKIATDTYSFERIREERFVYVDKTAALKSLADGSIGAQFFIARPRRFGKSLMISTLKCLFEGRRELFKGLAIEPEWDWSKKWPVLHLDMGSCQAADIDKFEENTSLMLRSECNRNGVHYDATLRCAGNFRLIIEQLAEKSPDGKMVLLIDEYDKPLLGQLGKPEVLKFRDALKEFYSVVKTLEGKQRFAMITGVSKFSKVSIFSDLNNLIDVTMDLPQATLLGYTHDEVKKYFPEKLKALGAANGKNSEEAFAELCHWYDGYRFHHAAELIINPVSVGMCLNKGEFRNYWASTAVPTFLVDILEKSPKDLQLCEISEDQLSAYEPDKLNLTTLMYQTGYLTIAGFENLCGERFYKLDFPNREVRNSFLSRTAMAYSHLGDSTTQTAQITCIRALYNRDLDKFFNTFKCLFANMPYDLTAHDTERVYEAIMTSILWFIGVGVKAEVHTNDGAIDAVFETDRDIYVLEFKRDESAKAALDQIAEKKYCDKYLNCGKPVTAIGVNFDAERRTVGEWKAVLI